MKVHNLFAKGLVETKWTKSEMISANHFKTVSQETKDKISQSRKKYLLEHKDEVPYLKNHYSKGRSYPEQYFYDWLTKEGIQFEEQYQVSLYCLDFKIRKY